MGDELGSRIVASRLARDLMRLCLLIGRRYAPYSKWLGTAFSRLAIAGALGPVLERALLARTFPDRADAMVEAFEVVARHQNDTNVAASVDPDVSHFYSHPFRVLRARRLASVFE